MIEKLFVWPTVLTPHGEEAPTGPRVARPDDRLRAVSGRCFASPGEPCRPPLHLGFHPRDALLRVVIGAVRCINVPLSRKSHFCVPLVTITFKTWVFLNFAMERPSRFASLKEAIPRTRGWMQDRCCDASDWSTRLKRPRTGSPDLVTQDRPQPIERKVINRAARSTPVCDACGSDDIICHATAQWSNEAQEWQLANTFNQPAHCNTCHHDGNLVWLTLN